MSSAELVTLRSRKPPQTAMLDPEGNPSLSLCMAVKRQRRWRLAFAAINFTRALYSLYRKALEKKQLLLTLPYVAIDIQEGRDDHPPDAQVGNPSDDHSPFLTIDQKTLTEMVREKNLDSLAQLGGVQQVATALETDKYDGIRGTEADLAHRIKVFGANKYQKPPAKSFLSFVYEAFKDPTIIILLGCAMLTLTFGIKQHGAKDGWYDGGSIIFAIFLVIFVSAVSNFKQNKQFEKLSSENSNIKVEVVRGRRRQTISVFEVVVGDVVCLKTGDQIPADGLFLHGHSIKVDESSMTGESDHVEINNNNNPFFLSGTKLTDGFGSMLVTSVGMNTAWGEMMSSISSNLDEQTPLQARLSKLTSFIGKIGLSVALLVLAVLLIRYFTGNTRDEQGNRAFDGSKTKLDKLMNSILSIISSAVTIIVVAIPEGLPLAVTLTLAFSMKRMMSDHALVRKLSACETMGSATTICTDKTGTLTMNQMKVTEFWLGKEEMKTDTYSDIAVSLFEWLQEGVSLNTTAFVYSNPGSCLETSGSPTEKAILSWAILDLEMNLDEPKQKSEVLSVEPFSSEKKMSGVLTRRNDVIHQHWKGAAEMILDMCSHYCVKSGATKSINEEERTHIKAIIQNMAGKSLRCIAFAHKIIPEEEQNNSKLEESGLTLLGLVGLKDPCRPGVGGAIESCRNAGVNIKMVTGDNVFTAKAIAIECGILKPEDDMNDEAIVEGTQFRSYSPAERVERIDKIRVMARSSPFDKLLMVQCLKQSGHVVAVTGDGTNDAPALKEADIGLSMGIQGTEVAKESSDIVILDDNFNSVVTVLRWGRCVYNNIQKFIQFQLTVNIAALVINFVAATFSGEVPLTAVQMLWVNLIMDTLGALALATEQPTDDLMTKPPVGRSQPLISNVMWRNLIAQAVYQIIVLLTLQYRGTSIFGVEEKVKNTLVFNTFVLCQLLNEFNARKLEETNVFEGLQRNKLFIGIIGMTLILQVVMVEFLTKFANTQRLNWAQWGACIGIAALSWPIGFLAKCIPVPS